MSIYSASVKLSVLSFKLSLLLNLFLIILYIYYMASIPKINIPTKKPRNKIADITIVPIKKPTQPIFLVNGKE